jgi:TPR repeat protein
MYQRKNLKRIILLFGLLLMQTHSAEVEALKSTCGIANKQACLELGDLYRDAHDFKQMKRYYEAACMYNEPKGCIRLAKEFAKRDDGKSKFWAYRNYADACELKSGEGCYEEAAMYARGDGVKKDSKKAIQLYWLASRYGYAKADVNLGNYYLQGHTVGQNFKRATELFAKACQSKDMLGCNNLGLNYLRGTGTHPDKAKAFQLFKTACNGDNGEGCRNLGSCYFTGTATAKDKHKAYRYYLRSCQLNNGGGCYQTSILLIAGDGNIIKGLLFAKKACKLKHETACKKLSSSVSLMKQSCLDGNQDVCDKLNQYNRSRK